MIHQQNLWKDIGQVIKCFDPSKSVTQYHSELMNQMLIIDQLCNAMKMKQIIKSLFAGYKKLLIYITIPLSEFFRQSIIFKRIIELNPPPGLSPWPLHLESNIYYSQVPLLATPSECKLLILSHVNTFCWNLQN